MSKTRTPAPVRLFTAPAGLMLRPVRRNRAAKKRSTELDRAIAKRIPTSIDEPQTPAGTDIRSWAYQNRRAVVAPVAAAALLALGRVFTYLTPPGWAPGQFAIAIPALLLSFAAYRWVQTIKVERHTQAAQATIVVALGWLVWPASWQIPTGAPAHVARWSILLLGTLIVCGVRHQRFAPREVEEVPTESGPEQRWAETVGRSGPLAGTYLRDVHRVISQAGDDVGWRGEVVCTWGLHSATKVATHRELIAGAYERDLIDFTPERTGNALIARVMLTERDPFPQTLKAKIRLNGDGTFVIGSYADGSDCLMRAFTPGHGVHDFWFFGVKGSGKSTLVDSALGSLMSRGWVVLHLTDLKGGMSLPEWKQVAYRFGKTAADGLMMLRRLDAIGAARMAECERHGWKVLDVSSDWPIHFGLIEEAPQLWKIKEAVEIAERIETLYRAVLVALGSVSQMAQLQQAWGNSSTLRVQAQAGNVGCGYLPKDEANLGFDHFHPDMSLIEKGSYHWYVTSPVESREVLVKIAQVDSAKVAREAIPGAPHPIDLVAIERVEREEAERLAAISEETAVADAVEKAGVNRDTVEAAARQAVKAAGGPVLLGDVARILAPAQMDELARKRHDDSVGQYLKKLVADPTSVVCKPTDATGKAIWGKYGVAS